MIEPLVPYSAVPKSLIVSIDHLPSDRFFGGPTACLKLIPMNSVHGCWSEKTQ